MPKANSRTWPRALCCSNSPTVDGSICRRYDEPLPPVAADVHPAHRPAPWMSRPYRARWRILAFFALTRSASRWLRWREANWKAACINITIWVTSPASERTCNTGLPAPTDVLWRAPFSAPLPGNVPLGTDGLGGVPLSELRV